MSNPDWSNHLSQKDKLEMVFSLWCYLRVRGDYNMITDALTICEKYNVSIKDYEFVLIHFNEFKEDYSEVYTYHDMTYTKEFFDKIKKGGNHVLV